MPERDLAVFCLRVYLDTHAPAYLRRGVALARGLGVPCTSDAGWWPEDVYDLIDTLEKLP